MAVDAIPVGGTPYNVQAAIARELIRCATLRGWDGKGLVGRCVFDSVSEVVDRYDEFRALFGSGPADHR